AATTSRSSKLIHGGLRYLELFDVGLVRESLRERETLNRLAPHLVRPLPFLVPIYRDSSRGLIKVRIGLTLYDWLTPGRDRERYRVLPPIDTLSLEPAIRAEDLRGAGYYFDDLLVFPERLCLENVLSACRHGARAFNYAQVEEIVRAPGGAPAGVRVRDLVTGRGRTRASPSSASSTRTRAYGRSRTRRASASPTSRAPTRSSPRRAGASCRSPAPNSPASGASRPGSAMPSCAPSAAGRPRGPTGSRSTGSTRRPGASRRAPGSTSPPRSQARGPPARRSRRSGPSTGAP